MANPNRKKATEEKRMAIRLPPALYNEILAESKITLSSGNEVVKRRLLISYGMMPQPTANK